ncbi:translation initiation factor IF-2 [Secundilactobacillus paracollinoides]|uniref:Translation initiation factor IF-2 n=1 Tax=Secundilactobacillus paracollinoides TaxID=240427 RepID=A0A1B2J0L5_9LACO|nr:translation initiation factor IF-2 [Secundilactobacillus paracollinoides]ANZ61870.1 translation initiation factor IF-2 [Secundilactobacillus paracollinoides]ANZ63509.1 translation initiation factor IF-2 [Secundilactobacillus paracollinoides]ANZ67790.1 translation initiation factor IF-2 [Secundilactobacillus paracollinoides]
MGKKRIYELAKELNVSSKAIVDTAQNKGFAVKNHMSSLGDNEERQLRAAFSKPKPTSASKSPAQNVSHSHTDAGANQSSAHSKDNGNNNHNMTTNNNRNTSNNGGNGSSANRQHRDETHQNRQNNNHSSNTQHSTTNGQRSNNGSQHASTQRSNNSQGRSNTTRSNNGNGQRSTTSSNRSNNSQRSNNNGQRSNNNGGGQRSTNGQRSNNSNNGNRSNNSQNRSSNRSNGGSSENRSGSGRFGGSLNNNNSRGGRNGNSRNNRNNNNRRRNNNKKYNKKNQRIKEVNHPKGAPERKDKALPEVLNYSIGMNAQDLGKILHREPAEIVKKLFMLGVMVNQNQSLDKDTIEILAAEYGIEAQEKVEVDVSDIDKFFEEEEQNTDHLENRPPVVTIMGHVDHGKTTLLDHLRHSHITAGEAGGITQAIGAYQLKHNGKTITFLDTPGHAAFTEMRARGADITDITVLVVAADDGVMPQTIEAINHAKAAETPIIVAVNKIDKPGANPNHVIEQLTEYGLIPEDWGGDTIFVQISAKFGTNIDDLLDMILLQAEVMELQANPQQNAAGSVIEARLDKGLGSVATLLVQQGTMHVGDPVVVGNTFGRVRTMQNERGKDIKKAAPSTPVEITGLSDVPEAGDRFVVFDDEKTARTAGEERAKNALMEERKSKNRVTLDNLFDTMKEGEMKEVDVIIKADVQGSVEALANSLNKIEVEGVRVNIIHTSVGAINESDVTLAEASNAIIIGFNVRPTPQAKAQADQDEVDIRLHRVIYNAIDEIEHAMKGKLEPTYEEEIIGQVEVREIFKASKIGTIAGGMVTDGHVSSDADVRLIRDGVVIYEGKLGSLKRFKDDVKDVKQGHELGLTIENYNDIKVGDVVEAYVMKEIPIE